MVGRHRNGFFCVIVTALAVWLPAASAWAQFVPPPAVPQHRDEPLPAWMPPRQQPEALYLRVSPEVSRAHGLRQAGLWCMSFGGASLFAGALLWSNARDINNTLSYTHSVVEKDASGGLTGSTSPLFDPELEDQRDQRQAASWGLLITGGAVAIAGAVLFTVGQLRLRASHREHPHDPLPPLSGY